MEEFVKKTEGPVRLSAVARPGGIVRWKVGIHLLSRSNKPGLFGRKWLLRHEHDLTDFDSFSGAVGHPAPDIQTLHEELRLPMQNANAFLPHLARRIESLGRTAEFEINDWDKSFEEIEAERNASKKRKKDH